MLRQALDARYNASEISVDVYNASLSEINSNEAREIEQHSDAMLANVVRGINEDIGLIDASITDIETQIAALSDPEAIAALLSQIPGLLTEKYQLLRDALDERYAAGEISVDVYNASLTALATTEASETERHSDAVLAQTLANIDDDVELIDANIGALQLAVENSDDPEAIAGLLDAIKLLVMDKYETLRERLGELLTAEEISQTAFDAATTALGTAESRQLASIDTQALTAISTATQEQVSFINGAIDNLRVSLELTDDPAESQQILDAIKVLVGSRFDVLIQELHDIRDSLDPEVFEQSLTAFQLGKQLAIENIDTQKFGIISEAAQGQVDFINGGIENLRVSLELTDDPAQQQQIIDAIKVLTSARFQVLREELIAIRDTLKPEEFEQALGAINLSEQLTLENLDTEKFGAIRAAAQEQVTFINKDIENLRLAFELTDDPAERQALLDTIKILTAARFDILREELEDIRERLSPEEYQQALTGLNLGETLALENIDTEKFGVISASAQKQVDFVNGAISNLELAFQLSDDPAEAQRILDAIKILVAKRFEILIEELKAIEDSFDDPALFTQALTGLELGSQVALQGIDNRSIGITLEGFTGRIRGLDAGINALFDDLSEQTTAAGINTAVDRLRTAIEMKYDLIRGKIEASAESEETQAEQIAAVNVQEAGELQRLGEQGLGAFDSLINTAQFLLDNATEAQFSNRREALITAINTFYDERIAFINGLDLTDTDRRNMLAVVDIQRNIAVEAVPQMHQSVTDRLELEKDLQADIADLRDDAIDGETDRLNSIVDLHERHNETLLELEQRFQRDLDDLRTDRIQDAQDDALAYQRDLEDLQNEFARQLFDDSVISYTDLTQAQRQQLTQDTEFRQEVFDLNTERGRDQRDLETEFGELRPGSAGYNFYRDQLEQGELTNPQTLEELFGREGLSEFTQFSRGVTDAGTDLESGLLDVNTRSANLLDSINTNIALLVGQSALGNSDPQAIGAAASTASLLPSATVTPPAGQDVSPVGIPSGGFGGQDIRISLVGDFGDGFVQKLAEALVRLNAEGRILQGGGLQ